MHTSGTAEIDHCPTAIGQLMRGHQGHLEHCLEVGDPTASFSRTHSIHHLSEKSQFHFCQVVQNHYSSVRWEIRLNQLLIANMSAKNIHFSIQLKCPRSIDGQHTVFKILSLSSRHEILFKTFDKMKILSS